MSDTVNILTYLTLDGSPNFAIGDKTIPEEVLVTNGQVFSSENIVIADNYTATVLWSTADGGVSDFLWGVLISDSDVLIQIKNGLGTPEYLVESVLANVPFYFGYSTRGRTTSSLTTGVQTTGLGSTTEIKVQRNVADAVGDALCSLYLFR